MALFNLLKDPPGIGKASQEPLNEAVRPSLKSLIELSRPAAQLPLYKSPIRALQSGNSLSRIKGRGMEFDEARPYIPGDDIRTLDWRVTARTGKTHTKLFREERERPVFVSVDYRSSMFFATRGLFKSCMAARLAGLLAWCIHHHDDRVGGQIFADEGYYEFKPQNGKPAVLHLLKRLAELSAFGYGRTARASQSEQALQQSLARLCRHARSGSLVFLLSDFRRLSAAGEAYLARLARRCDITLIFIYDHLERELPPAGRYRLSDGEREITLLTGDKAYAARYREQFRGHQARLQTLARKHGLRFMACSTTADPIRMLQRGLQFTRIGV